MMPGRRRNWLLKSALVVMSFVLALFGMLGWANKANAFNAVALNEIAALDPLWPIYGVAAIGCVAAQIIAACAAVNFAWLEGAGRVWRWLAGAFYGVCVVFAAYSADLGAQAILSNQQRAAAASREQERDRLQAEIISLNGVVAAERQRMSDPGTVGPQTRAAETAAFLAATEAERARLPLAQAALDASPPLPREVMLPWHTALGVFLVFLAWAFLEPWGYALAERGRQPATPNTQHRPTEAAIRAVPLQHSQAATPSLWRRAAAWVSFLLVSHAATAGLAHANTEPEPRDTPNPLTQPAAIDAKAQAFSMRDRFDVPAIAAKVGVHQSTVYRWFAKRDKELASRTVSAANGAQGALAL